MALQTPLTDLLGIKHPIMLAGMNGVSHSDLAAAVSNAGQGQAKPLLLLLQQYLCSQAPKVELGQSVD